MGLLPEVERGISVAHLNDKTVFVRGFISRKRKVVGTCATHNSDREAAGGNSTHSLFKLIPLPSPPRGDVGFTVETGSEPNLSRHRNWNTRHLGHRRHPSEICGSKRCPSDEQI